MERGNYKLAIGVDVAAQHKNDWPAENGAVKSYNTGIKLAVEVGDNDTLEPRLDQIKQMGIGNYLTEQMG